MREGRKPCFEVELQEGISAIGLLAQEEESARVDLRLGKR